jgi:hypothetical protein
VKRIFSAIGHPVLKLKRVGFGPIRLGNLPVGQMRSLTDEEMEGLKKLIAVRTRDEGPAYTDSPRNAPGAAGVSAGKRRTIKGRNQ